jgi:hypothetical protein
MDRGFPGRHDSIMRNVLNRLIACGWLGALAVAALPGTAHAVDIVNKDNALRVVVVNEDNGDSNVVTLPAKQKFDNVCRSCVVLFGNTSVEAEGNVTVVIERGKIAIAKK